jgi:hypothetical protein
MGNDWRKLLCPKCHQLKKACTCKPEPTSRLMVVRVGRETKGRGGKGVTIISDSPLDENGIRTSEAVAASLWAFFRYGNNPEECLIRAVNFGGDADTIGAMVGAQLGSLYGSEWIPRRWYTQIENRRHGRDFMVDLAKRLAHLDIRSD